MKIGNSPTVVYALSENKAPFVTGLHVLLGAVEMETFSVCYHLYQNKLEI